MGIVMRIIQQYDPCHENEFMALEKKFDELEKKRPDYPKGKRNSVRSVTIALS